MAATDIFAHPRHLPYGENLYYSWGSVPSCGSATRSWYNEIRHYNYRWHSFHLRLVISLKLYGEEHEKLAVLRLKVVALGEYTLHAITGQLVTLWVIFVIMFLIADKIPKYGLNKNRLFK